MAKRKPKPRRAKGEGAYWYDKTTQRHCYRLEVAGRRRTVADRNPARAKARFEALKQQAGQGIDIDGGKQTLTDWINTWLESVVRRNIKPSTYENYCALCERLLLPTLGDYRLDALTPAIIRAWLNAATDKKIARASLRNALGILRRALDTAVQDRLIATNPAQGLKVPGRLDDDAPDRALSREQEAALLKAAERYYLSPLYVLALRLGMRRGELLGLRWQDIDVDTRVLRVQQQVIRLDDKPVISTPKTKAARRVIPLTADLLDILRAHRAKNYERKLRAGAAWQEHDLVFCTEHGRPIFTSNLLQNFTSVRKRAGLEDVRFHDLRHTAITRMREAGIDAETVAAIAGHTHVKTTLNVYSSVDEERKRRALEKLA